eukprot:Em0006g172a
MDEHHTYMDEHHIYMDEHHTYMDEHHTYMDEHLTYMGEHHTYMDEHHTYMDEHRTYMDEHHTYMGQVKPDPAHKVITVKPALLKKYFLAFKSNVIFHYHTLDGCPQFSLTSPPMGTYSCPGSSITYTCVLSSSAPFTVITLWSGSAFQCLPTNLISLTQRSSGAIQPFPSGSCGSLSAVTTNVTSTCYTSVLTIPAVQALNGTTVVCYDGNTGAVVGSDTLRIMRALPPDNTTIKAVSVFNPNNTLRHLEITWTPVGGAVTIYGVYHGGGIYGYTSCTTPQCFYVVPVSVASTSYVISVASVNKDGDVGPKSTTTIYGTTNNTFISHVMTMAYVSMATIGCSFSTNQCFYCVVCCSTDPSVPPDSSVCNISTTRGTEVTVSLQGLTSGQMYYCKAAATNTNSNNCAGPVVGGVKVFFSFMTSSVPITSSSSPTSTIITLFCFSKL